MKIKIEIRVYRQRNNSKGYGVNGFDIKEYFVAIGSPEVYNELLKRHNSVLHSIAINPYWINLAINYYNLFSSQVLEDKYISLCECCCSEDFKKDGINLIYCDVNLCSFFNYFFTVSHIYSTYCIDFPNNNDYWEELVIKDGKNLKEIERLAQQLGKEYDGKKDEEVDFVNYLLNHYLWYPYP